MANDGFGITVTPAGALEDFAADVLDPAAYDALMIEAIETAVEFLQKEVIRRTPMDSGRAVGRIFGGVSGGTYPPTGEVWSDDVEVATLEEGRRAGAAMPPVDAIAPWVANHLGDDRIAYVVARAIGSRGLPAHRMFEQAAAESADTIASMFVDIVFGKVGR